MEGGGGVMRSGTCGSSGAEVGHVREGRSLCVGLHTDFGFND